MLQSFDRLLMQVQCLASEARHPASEVQCRLPLYHLPLYQLPTSDTYLRHVEQAMDVQQVRHSGPKPAHLLDFPPPFSPPFKLATSSS